MQKAIIGKKVGMTQIFDESGKVIPVTVVEAGPCTVTQLKTVEKDGYAAVQLGYQDVKESKLTKPPGQGCRGHPDTVGEVQLLHAAIILGKPPDHRSGYFLFFHVGFPLSPCGIALGLSDYFTVLRPNCQSANS